MEGVVWPLSGPDVALFDMKLALPYRPVIAETLATLVRIQLAAGGPASRTSPPGRLPGPMIDRQRDVTELLLDWSEGDEAALGRLIPRVEAELRQIARRHMHREARGHTLQPTALVNELYLKLVDQRRVQWRNRAHFYGTAANIMRRILVDHARIRNAEKRGQGARPVSLEEVSDVPAKPNRAQPDVDLIALDDALKFLAEVDERQSRIVELRYFTGLGHREIGEVLGISDRTVRREWRTARLWLHQEISRRPPAGGRRQP